MFLIGVALIFFKGKGFVFGLLGSVILYGEIPNQVWDDFFMIIVDPCLRRNEEYEMTVF